MATSEWAFTDTSLATFPSPWASSPELRYWLARTATILFIMPSDWGETLAAQLHDYGVDVDAYGVNWVQVPVKEFDRIEPVMEALGYTRDFEEGESN